MSVSYDFLGNHGILVYTKHISRPWVARPMGQPVGYLPPNVSMSTSLNPHLKHLNRHKFHCLIRLHLQRHELKTKIVINFKIKHQSIKSSMGLLSEWNLCNFAMKLAGPATGSRTALKQFRREDVYKFHVQNRCVDRHRAMEGYLHLRNSSGWLSTTESLGLSVQQNNLDSD